MPDNVEVVKPISAQAGTLTVTSTGLAEQQYSVSNEKSITAAAAAARAEIETRIVAALRHPRDVDAFRQGILKDCHRPGFADLALFHKPIGGGEIVDFSIRFIESALQHYRNLHVTSDIEYEDSEQAKLRVSVLDVQNNSGISDVALIDKLVERKQVKAGRKARGMRENSYGTMVYLVEATADEFQNAVNARKSKMIRDLVKRLLPRDILEECRTVIDATLADENAKDPDAAKKKIIDKFLALGVTVAMLKDFMGGALETVTAADLAKLTPVYNALKGGETTWADIMRSRENPEDDAKPDATQPRTKARDKVMQQPSFAEPATPTDKK